MAYAVGVDGCKKGWVGVKLFPDGKGEVLVEETFAVLWEKCSKAKLMLVDMPIGLVDEKFCGEKTKRPPDGEAKTLLRKRSSCVFDAPTREAVCCTDYRKAKAANRKITGKMISCQSFAISPKIRELDEFLTSGPGKKHRKVIREAHPEICFYYLNKEKPVLINKKKDEGYRLRLGLLKKVFPKAENIIELGMKNFKRKDVGRDDIVDAFVAALVASSKNLSQIPEKPIYDSKGLAMEMVHGIF